MTEQQAAALLTAVQHIEVAIQMLAMFAFLVLLVMFVILLVLRDA